MKYICYRQRGRSGQCEPDEVGNSTVIAQIFWEPDRDWPFLGPIAMILICFGFDCDLNCENDHL